jgi:geranylgeranyl reductase
MEKRDVVIVGAGPAGLMAAKILGMNARDVLVLEAKKNIGKKICTGLWGITEKTAEMKIPKFVFDKKFKKIIFHTPHLSTTLKEDKPFVASINREMLGQWMAKKAKALGAEIRTGSPVTKINKDYVVVNGKKIGFNHLIGADGSNSIVRRYLQLPVELGLAFQYKIKQRFKDMEVSYDADKFGPWYAWIVPHKKQTFIGAVGVPRIWPVGKAKKKFHLWLGEKGIDYSDAEFEGAPINHIYKGHEFGNISLAGDAAGFPSGLTGEGIYFAMASGWDIAEKILNPRYRCKRIDLILAIKRKHEAILKSFMLNRTLERIEYTLMTLLLKNKLFDKKIIDLVG